MKVVPGLVYGHRYENGKITNSVHAIGAYHSMVIEWAFRRVAKCKWTKNQRSMNKQTDQLINRKQLASA